MSNDFIFHDFHIKLMILNLTNYFFFKILKK